MWTLIALWGCSGGGEGVFVGNPTGKLNVAVAPTDGLRARTGAAIVESVALRGCNGADSRELPGEDLVLTEGRSTAGIDLPTGDFCGIDVEFRSLTLTLTGGPNPVRLDLPAFSVALRGSVAIGADDETLVLLGQTDWLAEAVNAVPNAEGTVEVDGSNILGEAALQVITEQSTAEQDGSIVATTEDLTDPGPPDTDTDTDPVFDTDDWGTVPNGYVEEGPCDHGGPGTLMAVRIPESAMNFGAGAAYGEGWCLGSVRFTTEDVLQTTAMFDYTTQTVSYVDYNNQTGRDCGEPHCDDLAYADGSLTESYCTILAVCENGTARTTGFTW